MSNRILKNDEIILHCANWAMESFYENFREVLAVEGLSDKGLWVEILEQLDQDSIGRGCVYFDINTYFNHGEDKLSIELFVRLVEKTIEQIKLKKEVASEYREAFIKLLEEFKSKIL